MATEFLMPKLGLTMEEGTIAEWLVPDGAEVSTGQAVLRIETDKTETDVEAAASGRLHPTADIGDTFACGERIGWFLAEGEDVPTGTAPAGTATPAAPDEPAAADPAPAAATSPEPAPSDDRIIASPLAKRLASERGIDLRQVRGTGPGGRIVKADVDEAPDTTHATPPVAAAPPASAPPATAAPRPAGTSSVPATAAARQLADLLGLDLSAVPVDPHDGRITRDGVAQHVRGLLAAPSTPAAGPLPPATQEPTSVTKLSGMRGTIAKRMHQSLSEMAQLSLFMDADLEAVVKDRSRRKKEGGAPSYTDYVIAAAARALREHPHVNSQITDDGVASLPDVHVGMAVALDGGLVVPVIRDTASRDLASLAAESSRLADAARSGNLALTDLEGGTFSVSTLGMFGVDGFTPVINPPNTAILGVGRLRDDVVLRENKKGKLKPATVTRLTLSLTWDHRAFDGAPAAEFCRTIVDLLQSPGDLDGPA